MLLPTKQSYTTPTRCVRKTNAALLWVQACISSEFHLNSVTGTLMDLQVAMS